VVADDAGTGRCTVDAQVGDEHDIVAMSSRSA
jgi:hypothetical protein